jgi:exoribonuclease-2
MPNGALARADTLPLVFGLTGTQGLARGARVRARVESIDEISLDVHAAVIERLDAPSTGDQPEDDEEEVVAGPLAIAVDVDEESGPAGDAPSTATPS